MPKRYVATFLFGRTSPTEDIEGEVSELVAAPIPSREHIKLACTNFLGTIQQRPPAFSALKVGGKRAYELARRGQAVELEPRAVTMYALQLIAYEYPRLVLDVRCSAGTYIRSLGRDLAESLGTGAVMSELVRTEIGTFGIENAINPHEMTASTLAHAALPPQAALEGLIQIVLDGNELDAIAHGRLLTRPTIASSTLAGTPVAALDQNGELVAILKRRADGAFAAYINFIGRN
jgi:tRNA pseudouridine55 synthase